MALPHAVLMPDASHPTHATRATLTIRPTTSADLPDVLSVLDEAAAWLQSIGVTQQWPPNVSRDVQWVDYLTRFAAEGRLHVAQTDDGATVGAFLLLEGAGQNDPVWSAEEAAKPGAYLYRLAVRRSVAGKGVAAAMLDWAFHSAQGAGRVLRLDCWAGNDGLRRYYRSHGFEYVGDAVMKDWDGRSYSVSRFQRSV